MIVTLIRSCGTCPPSCVTAKPVHCMGNQPLPPELSFADGREVNKGLKCGAFAEKVVVHASQVAFVGDDVPAESACLLACGVPTGLGGGGGGGEGAAVNTARVRPGETVRGDRAGRCRPERGPGRAAGRCFADHRDGPRTLQA